MFEDAYNNYLDDSLVSSSAPVGGLEATTSMTMNPPKLSPLIAAYFVEGTFRALPTDDLSDLGKAGCGLSFEHLLPAIVRSLSTLDTSSTLSQTTTLREAQIALGEDAQKLAKVDTVIKTAQDIEGLSGVNTYLANNLYFLGFVVFGLLRLDPNESLDEDSEASADECLLVNAAAQLLYAINSLPVRRRFEREYPDKPYLPYALVVMYGRLGSLLLQHAKQIRVTRAALRGDLTCVSSSSVGQTFYGCLAMHSLFLLYFYSLCICIFTYPLSLSSIRWSKCLRSVWQNPSRRSRSTALVSRRSRPR